MFRYLLYRACLILNKIERRQRILKTNDFFAAPLDRITKCHPLIHTQMSASGAKQPIFIAFFRTVFPISAGIIFAIQKYGRFLAMTRTRLGISAIAFSFICMAVMGYTGSDFATSGNAQPDTTAFSSSVTLSPTPVPKRKNPSDPTPTPSPYKNPSDPTPTPSPYKNPSDPTPTPSPYKNPSDPTPTPTKKLF